MKVKNSENFMAKRLKRRQNKDRTGCMSGLVSIFDFRHDRITSRLLQDHLAHITETTTGPSCHTSEVNSLMDLEEIRQRVDSPNNENSEMAKTRVTELVEEDMQCDQTEEISSTSFNSQEITIDQQVPFQKPPQYHDLQDLMNKLLFIHEKTNEEEQKPKSLNRSNSLDHERNTTPVSEEPTARKNQNLFRRIRSKSHECISLNDNDTPLPSNRVTRSHHERSVSQFSFTEIKKKLKHAIGRSSRDSGCPEKPGIDRNSGRCSPNRDHFYSERFSRISNRFQQDEVSRLCKSERKLGENKEIGDASVRVSNIYIEAKKHLSEMLNNGNEDTELMMENHSRTLGKLLDFPGYNSRFSGSANRNEPMVNESQPSVTNDDHQEPKVSDEDHQAEGAVEIVKPPSLEEIEIFDSTDLTEEDVLSSSPIASPSGSSLDINKKSEEGESTSDDRTGKPSPVSVLEPLFSDDDISPARAISRSGECSIQPLRIRFEEIATSSENQEICIWKHVENEESAFEYVEAVLLASDLNWAEFEKRWLSSTQILDPSLYDELQIFSSRPSHDQRLLFDTTNEILNELCDCCLGFYSDKSNSVHSLPKGMNLINEVWESIETRLDCIYSRSLDQLVKTDMEVSRTWMDLRLETREIVTETEESIFEDMIDDTVLSLIHDQLALQQ